ncbi:TPA: hypothetical protein ACPVYZ_004257 [Vibrio parahaemolyticus]|uniref:hypothetical protein n=1 Tax=Vibrio parahaemolyticus TaxID=670 RepID=UPI00111DE776|nr:hypothetical protein [Vibrio parahaemolyticus]TOH19168.1 hypothetical protein CGI90_04085 [Vibrio parahaemolyticus]HCG7330452.1 hypothetical protein [Vibrio parahaemolyticus]HCG9589031.1 hypothetical protein [Vibrio parahaemolyticus]HCM0798105.1 hypothetical protein [Vibrio parahaemolyticus]HCM0883582.1 hypothetical protein [Vibrio parahaemolyticus]
MTKTELRNMHSKFQRDVAIFDNQKKLKAVDVMVVRQVSGGRNNINDLAKAMKITKNQLLSSLSKGVFTIKGDTILI